MRVEDITMESGVVDNVGGAHGPRASLTGLLRRLFTRRPAVDPDYDYGDAKERLIGRAFSSREQAAYERDLDTEREIQFAALQLSREGTDRACSDLALATELHRDSCLGEARRIGQAIFELRQKNNVTQIKRPVSA
jgi:hypothetical protein